MHYNFTLTKNAICLRREWQKQTKKHVSIIQKKQKISTYTHN